MKKSNQSNIAANRTVDNTPSSIGIIGCGWLGSALAQQLNAAGTQVFATRSQDKTAATLIEQGITTSVLSLPANQTEVNKHPIFQHSCVVIAITPKFRQGRVDYAQNVQQLVDAARESQAVKTVVLLSSTAVYNGLTGHVDEAITLDLKADKVALLNEAEQAVLSFSDELEKNPLGKKAYVLRLSGLVGPNRHPGKFLLNGRMLNSPNAIVNLIHQKDAVGLITSLLTGKVASGIFNGVSATQVTKKEYYQAAAKALQLPSPIFDEHSHCATAPSKVVSREKTKAIVDYSFNYDDLFRWLDHA